MVAVSASSFAKDVAAFSFSGTTAASSFNDVVFLFGASDGVVHSSMFLLRASRLSRELWLAVSCADEDLPGVDALDEHVLGNGGIM